MINRKQLEEMVAAEAEKHWRTEKAPETGDDACQLVKDKFIAGFLAAVPIIFEAANDTVPDPTGEFHFKRKYPTADSILEELQS